MSFKSNVFWQVEDGYSTDGRHQQTAICMDEIIAICETEEDVRKFIEDRVKEDFRNRISYGVSQYSMEFIVGLWRNRKQENNDG